MADITNVLKILPDISEMLYHMYQDETDKESISVRYDQYLAVDDAIDLLKEQQKKETSWIHRKDMDFKDKLGCNHIHGMCENCGFIHDFKDGHTAQYKYCPQCGGKAVQWKDGEQEC